MPEYAAVLKKRDEDKKELNSRDNSILRQVNGYDYLRPKCKSADTQLRNEKINC